MKEVVLFGQIIVSVALIAFVLMQAKGSGLGSAWGNIGASYHSKKGVEKVVFVATIVSATFFLILSVLSTAL